MSLSIASLSFVWSRLPQLSGRARLLASFLSGGLMAVAMPPFNLFPLLWICLPAQILLLRGTQSGMQAFWCGWAFAFGFFVFGLYWIAAAMFVDIGQFWWAIPFSVAGLPAYLALYYGIAAVIARKIGLMGIRGAIVFGLLFFAAEYARGHLLTGFPWILLGYTWSDVLPVLQVTSVVGIYGLTLATVIVACLPAAWGASSRFVRPAIAANILVFAFSGLWGVYRLQTTTVNTVPDVRIRLVQPNIEQADKWKRDERERHFEKLIELTETKGEEPITHVFWPETASPFYLSEDSFHRQEIAVRIPSAGAVMTGVIRRSVDAEGRMQFFNSLVAVDGMGRLVAGYDKAHLVPFGEFMPLRSIIPWRAIAASEADFSSGPGPRSLNVLGLPKFSPLICYEVIFPGKVVDPEERPGFLANVTNDGWYGRTTGPYQHFAIARVRAIEEGLPLVRVANTGISGIVDPLGRIIKKLGLGKEGIIDSALPESLGPTAYKKTGEIPVLVALVILFTLFAKVKKP